MDAKHDPVRQVDYLHETLAHDKTHLALFLGAGCPQAVGDGTGGPLIPGIGGLTGECCKAAAQDTQCSKPLRTVLDKLADEGDPSPDIERILSEIRGLRQVAGKAQVFGLTATDLSTLDDRICDHIVALTEKTLPDRSTPYHEVSAWIGAISRSHPVEVFTPNYDLLLEQALEESSVPYFDGFIGARQAFFDPHAIEDDQLPARWARLWKLHGSINWYLDADGTVFRAQGKLGKRCPLIYPSHMKYDESRKMPYLAMIDRLRAFLRWPACVLVVCGYSLRDQHINAVIVEGLQRNGTAAVFVLLHGEIARYPEAVRLAQARPNLTLVATDGGVVGGRSGSWIAVAAEGVQSRDPALSPALTATDAEDGKVTVKVGLGDFGALGGFLSDVRGSADERGAESHAR